MEVSGLQKNAWMFDVMCQLQQSVLYVNQLVASYVGNTVIYRQNRKAQQHKITDEFVVVKGTSKARFSQWVASPKPHFGALV